MANISYLKNRKKQVKIDRTYSSVFLNTCNLYRSIFYKHSIDVVFFKIQIYRKISDHSLPVDCLCFGKHLTLIRFIFSI